MHNDADYNPDHSPERSPAKGSKQDPGPGVPPLTIDWSGGAEEPWEQQISTLLQSLPPVEPPPGFLENLASAGPQITAPFTLDGDTPFTFPIVESDVD